VLTANYTNSAMATLTSLSLPASGDSESYFEAEVRRMLRHAKNPFLLASNRLAQAISEATGIPNARDAIRQVVETAFGCSFQERRSCELLLESLDERPRPAAQADAFEVSKRQFHRRRARAVASLAAHVRRILDRPVGRVGAGQALADPLEAMADLVSNIEPAIASEILRLSTRKAPDVPAALAAILEAQLQELAGDGRAIEPGARVSMLAGTTLADTEIRFEREWLNFLRARNAGDAVRMDRISRNLTRVASDRSPLVLRASLAQAESKLHRGCLDEASQILDETDKRSARDFAVTTLASSTLLRSELALCRADDAAAERLASGAYLVLRGRHYDSFRCQRALSRARLRLEQPWPWPEDADALRETAWDYVALVIERARHLLAAGDLETARSVAIGALETAQARGYRSLCARAAATIGATFLRETRRKREWFARALRHLLVTRDRSSGYDLFAFEKRGAYAAVFSRDETLFVTVLYDALLRTIPHLRPVSDRQREIARGLLAQLARVALGVTAGFDAFEKALEAAGDECPPFVQYFNYFGDDASEVVHAFFQAVAGFEERSRTEYRTSAALRLMAAAPARMANLRAFIVDDTRI
jgi:hypothetical protein